MEKIYESDVEQNTTSIERENLLKENPDLVFGVYKYLGEDENELKTELIGNALTCYKNQYEDGNIKGLDENPEVHLLDLGEYQQGRIVYLRKGTIPELNLKEGKKHQEGEVCYLSAGAHEIYVPNKKTGVKYLDFTVTERDSGAGDKGMYTIVAGRAIGTDINKETIREYIEERVSLGKDGFFYVPKFEKNDISLKEKEEILVQAIKSFVKNKLSNIQTYKDSVFEKIFGTNKKDFIQKLENIANGAEKPEIKESNLIDFTKTAKEEFVDTELGKNIKKINGEYFHLVYDERTGGFECKKIYINDSLNNGNIPLGQFFTESSNQRPKVATSEYVLNREENFVEGKTNKTEKYVPYFVEFVKQIHGVKKDVLEAIVLAKELSKVPEYIEKKVNLWEDYKLTITSYLDTYNDSELLELIEKNNDELLKKLVHFLRRNYWKFNFNKDILKDLIIESLQNENTDNIKNFYSLMAMEELDKDML